MEYWTDLYKEIAEKTTDKLTEIKWVDLWHDQISFLTSELPFETPAVFIGFSTLATEDRGGLIQDCDTQIDMYLFYETFSDTYWGSYNQDRALDYMNSLTRLHALFHGKDGVNYSSMRRVDLRREESGGSGNLYRISFQCIITDYSAQRIFIETESPDKNIDVKKDVIIGVSDGETPYFDVSIQK